MPTLENTHALIIGIANYRHIRPLPQAVLDDAQDVRDALVDENLCAYPPENVRLLLDDEATAAAIRQELTHLAERTDRDSTVTLYLSSHGGRVAAGEHAGEYIIPVEGLYDPTDPTDLAQTGISGVEFGQLLRAIPARKLLVMLDCCHAGGLGTAKSGAGDPLPGLAKGFSDEYYAHLQSGRGRVVFASARPEEESYILPGQRNSLFTTHLLAGLQGGVRSEDGFVRVFHLYEYIQPQVTGDIRLQHPIFKGELEDNFPVGLYRGGVACEIPRGEDGYEFDAYISYAEHPDDMRFVWEDLVPHLQENGVQAAVTGMVEAPGVAKVVGRAQAIERAKRTVLVLSSRYFADEWTNFNAEIASTLSVEEGKARVLPLLAEESLDTNSFPLFIRYLQPLDILHKYMGEMNWQRLVQILKGPLPDRYQGG